MQNVRERLDPWKIAGALIALSLVLAIAIATGLRVTEGNIAAVVIGWFFSQILVVSVWTALAQIKLWIRISSGAILVFIFALCLYCCANRDGGGRGIASVLAIGIVSQWLVCQIPLWWMQKKSWILSSDPFIQSETGVHESDFQFGILHLMIWTTLIAVFIGISRLLVPVSSDLSFAPRTIQIGMFFVFGNSIIALPVIWACLGNRRLIWGGVGVIVCVGVSFLEVFLASEIQMEAFVLIINGAQFLLSIVALHTLRVSGLRLVRLRDPA